MKTEGNRSAIRLTWDQKTSSSSLGTGRSMRTRRIDIKNRIHPPKRAISIQETKEEALREREGGGAAEERGLPRASSKQQLIKDEEETEPSDHLD